MECGTQQITEEQNDRQHSASRHTARQTDDSKTTKPGNKQTHRPNKVMPVLHPATDRKHETPKTRLQQQKTSYGSSTTLSARTVQNDSTEEAEK